jgi:purine-binding chemotaxis protein CheW
MNSQYIIFDIAGTAYGLPTQLVGHIEMIQRATRVPNAPHFVDGVVFSRGEVVPALNLRVRFGFDRVPFDTRTRLIVVHGGGRTVGLIVDSAREFVAIPESAIKPPSDNLSGMSGRYIRGIALIGGRAIVMLDLDEILREDSAVLAETAKAQRAATEEMR